MFLKNCWYVGAWSHELAAGNVIGRTIIGEPVALYRTQEGALHAVADRCPHRWVPLSLGRVEGDALRCGYHGLVFGPDGRCQHIPGADRIVPGANVRTFPVEERDSWLWVWMGDPARADPALIPSAFGLNDPRWTMRADQIDYAANYMLINDNLLDLSHVDFVHEKTLGAATDYGWSDEVPRVKPLDRGVRIERWLTGRRQSQTNPNLVDTWSTYDYLAPGVFIMENKSYPHGMAERCGFGEPGDKPMTYRVEQQAVAPINDRETRYFFATGFDATNLPGHLVEGIFSLVMSAFKEDRAIIEAQQLLWDRTDASMAKAFIPSDKAPAMFRRIMDSLIREEETAGAAAAA